MFTPRMCLLRIQEFSRQTYAHWISTTEKLWWNRHLDAALPFPVSLVAFPMVTPSGEIANEKWLPTSIFKQYVTLRTQNAGKPMFHRGREGIYRQCVFRARSIRNCLASNMWILQICPEDLTSRVRAMCFPALFKLCKHIAWSYQDCPWGNRLSISGTV